MTSNNHLREVHGFYIPLLPHPLCIRTQWSHYDRLKRKDYKSWTANKLQTMLCLLMEKMRHASIYTFYLVGVYP